jgi:hypothetical protein
MIFARPDTDMQPAASDAGLHHHKASRGPPWAVVQRCTNKSDKKQQVE